MIKLKNLHKYKAFGYRKDGTITIDSIIDVTKVHEHIPTAVFGEVYYYDEEDYKDYSIDQDQIGTLFTQIDEPVRIKEATNIILTILEAWMRIR